MFLLAITACACTTYGSEAETPAPERDAGGDGATTALRIHVAPFGRDFAEGTSNAPVATFARALALSAAHGGADIVVCEGTYEERVVIDRSVRIFGDRSCDRWAPSSTRARIASATGAALTITAAANVVVEAFEVLANADHTTRGSSAIGVYVSRASGVVLRNVKVTASGGIDGADGPPPATNWTGAVAVAGNATGAIGGTGTQNACFDGTSSLGGSGASASSIATSGSAEPNIGMPNSGSTGIACTDGGPGVDGPNGTAGAARTFAFELTPAGLAPKHGEAGGRGSPAQGGGGGGATESGGSGAGGAGGCGGSGGGGGTSGGSSIALLAYESDVVIEASTLVARDGANGGQGSDGQAGQAGTNGGSGACIGGKGGRGGSGAGGGGGAGGVSAAIFYVGASPKITTTTTTAGNAGLGGAGGRAANETLAGKPGGPGKAGDVITF